MSNYNYTFIDRYEELGWDRSQMVDITIVQRTMGTISLIGSTYVIQEVLRNERKRNHTFHRLMVGLSTSDILSSFFTHMLSTAPMPKGYHVLAVGNVTTCDIQGFITGMCGAASLFYICSLATYYLVQLKYNWTNRRIKALEKWLHIAPWSMGLVFTFPGLVFKMYGPTGFICSVTFKEYPIECTDPDSSVECIRGNPSMAFFLFIVLFGVIFLALCYISITMYIVYRNIANIEQEFRRYSVSPYRSAQTINDSKRSRRVMLQGVLYSLALFLTWIFIVEIFDKNESYGLYILSYMFWPLQGFFNALIYAIPVFQRMYKRWKTKRKERQTVVVSSKLEDKKDVEDVQNKKDKYNNQQHNQPVLVIGETKVVEEGGNNEFDAEEAKEEIQKNSESSIIHPGIRINDNNQFQLKRNDGDNLDDDLDDDFDDYLALSSRSEL